MRFNMAKHVSGVDKEQVLQVCLEEKMHEII
jgi:hypothetical protein